MENQTDLNHLLFHYPGIMTTNTLPNSSLCMYINIPHEIQSLKGALHCIIFNTIPHSRLLYFLLYANKGTRGQLRKEAGKTLTQMRQQEAWVALQQGHPLPFLLCSQMRGKCRKQGPGNQQHNPLHFGPSNTWPTSLEHGSTEFTAQMNREKPQHHLNTKPPF